MARKIITIDAAQQPTGAYEAVVVFWLAAPANRVVPKPGATSKVPNATVDELTALQNGTVVEQVHNTGAFATGTTRATARALMVERYNAAQTALDNTAPPVDVVGDYWDGTAWTVA